MRGTGLEGDHGAEEGMVLRARWWGLILGAGGQGWGGDPRAGRGMGLEGSILGAELGAGELALR